MGKAFCITSLTVIFLLLIFSCKEESPKPTKKWTFLLYDDADFNDAYDPLDTYPGSGILPFYKLASSDANVNYLVLRDRIDTEACYYKIDESNNLVQLQRLGEQNMGSSGTLSNFIKYAKENYPAERYITAFYDHGGGWMGTCLDASSSNDWLTAYEIESALSLSGGVDMVLFTAPCLMASVETAYQVRNTCDFYIGSEDLSGFLYWSEMMHSFDKLIKANPDISTEELAIKVIDLHSKNIADNPTLTMSAVKTANLKELVEDMNDVFNYYRDHMNDFTTFTSGRLKTYHLDYCDLKGLLVALFSQETNTDIKNTLSGTIEQFDKCVVANSYGVNDFGSNGLNIYFPTQKYSDEVYYSPYGDNLEFSQHSWASLLQKLLSGKSKVKDNTLESLFNRDCLLSSY
jgi:hypothetical protein